MSNPIMIAVGKSNSSSNTVLHSVHPNSGQPVYIQAFDQAHYRLADAETGLTPENLEFTRNGNDLYIQTTNSTSETPDIVIKNYYTYYPEVVGNSLPAGFYAADNTQEYTVETTQETQLAEEVTINSSPQETGGSKIPLALGGLVGAGLVGALAGGGGGGSSEHNDTKATNVSSIANPSKADTSSQPQQNSSQPSVEAKNNTTSTIKQTEPTISTESEDKTTNQSSDSENVPETPDTKQENTTQQPSETNKQPEENQAVQPPLETEKNDTTAE
ncbi:hypothetical protein, partial [Neisseria montereyensis]